MKSFFTRLTLFLSSLFLASQANAQPITLVQGELSIIGISSNAPKGLSFITWVPLTTGTEIRFTDNGFYSTATSKSPGNSRWQESLIVWTATAPVTAGTVIKIEGETTNTGTANVMNADGNTSATTLAINNNSADQVFAYQGPNMPATTTAGYVFNGTFNNTILAGIGYPSASGAAGSTGWSTGTSAASGVSYLPMDLLPINTIYLTHSATGGQYNGSRTGLATAADYKLLIADVNNWTLGLGTTTPITYNMTSFQLGSTLPLTLLSFTGQLNTNTVQLEWKTDDEYNVSAFEVQRSADGRTYSSIGTVAAMNVTGTHTYSYSDPVINSPVTYYRLKQLDRDGRFTYSSIIALSGNRKTATTLIYPNPFTSEANLSVTLSSPETISFALVNNTGAIIKQWQRSLPKGQTVMTVGLEKLVPGIYYLKLQGPGMPGQLTLIKQ